MLIEHLALLIKHLNLLIEHLALLIQLLVLFFNDFISLHDGSVSVFYSFEEFIFHVHVLAYFRIGGGRKQTFQNILHVCISGVGFFVHLYGLWVPFGGIRLIKNAQNLL